MLIDWWRSTGQNAINNNSNLWGLSEIKLPCPARRWDHTGHELHCSGHDFPCVLFAELETTIFHNCFFPSLTGMTSQLCARNTSLLWTRHKMWKIKKILSILHRAYTELWMHFSCIGSLSCHWTNEGSDTLYDSATLTNEPLAVWALNQNPS